MLEPDWNRANEQGWPGRALRVADFAVDPETIMAATQRIASSRQLSKARLARKRDLLPTTTTSTFSARRPALLPLPPAYLPFLPSTLPSIPHALIRMSSDRTCIYTQLSPLSTRFTRCFTWEQAIYHHGVAISRYNPDCEPPKRRKHDGACKRVLTDLCETARVVSARP